MDVYDVKSDVDKDRALLKFLRDDAIRRLGTAPNLPSKYSIDQLKENLVKDHCNMQEPIYTLPEYQNVVDANLDQYAEVQHVNQFLFGPNFYDKNARKLKQRKFTVEDGFRTLYYDFDKECMSTDPLEFSHEIEWEKHLKNHVVYYPDTESISIVATLTNLIKKCEFLGFSFAQMSRTWLLLVKHHYPLLLDTATHYASSERTLDIFHLIVDNIDLNYEREKLEQTRLSVARKPGQNISEISKKLTSIYQQYLKITSGIVKQEEVEKSAQGLALSDLSSFISEKCRTKLERWMNEKKLGGHPANLSEAVRQIQHYETDVRNQITSTAMNKNAMTASQLTNIAVASWEGAGVNNVDAEDAGEDEDGGEGGEYDVDYVNSRQTDSRPRGGFGGRGGGDRSRQPGSNQRYDGSSGQARGRGNTRGRGLGQTRGRSPGQSRGYGNRDSSSESQRGRERTRNNSWNRNSSSGESTRNDRPKSPKSFNTVKYIDAKTHDPPVCWACFSPSHRARSCPRYTADQTSKDTACRRCKRYDNRLVYHFSHLCRFHNRDSQDRLSYYRSPSRDTRQQRQEYNRNFFSRQDKENNQRSGSKERNQTKNF